MESGILGLRDSTELYRIQRRAHLDKHRTRGAKRSKRQLQDREPYAATGTHSCKTMACYHHYSLVAERTGQHSADSHYHRLQRVRD